MNEGNLAWLLTFLILTSVGSLIGLIMCIKEIDRVVKTQRLISELLDKMVDFDKAAHSQQEVRVNE